MAHGGGRAAQVHADAGPNRSEGAGEGRRSGRAVRRGAHGSFPRAFEAESGVAPGAAEKWFPHARSAHEGTQEVWTKGGASALPVQQAVIARGSMDKPFGSDCIGASGQEGARR